MPLPPVATRRAIAAVVVVTALQCAFFGAPPSAQTPAAPAPATTAPAAAPRPPQSVLGATPAPQRVPVPGPATDQPYAPQAILPGGIVVPIFPAGSPMLKADRVREPEVYNMTGGVPGRIASIVNIHNPSIELHRVPGSLNTGAAMIVVAGGGHNTLNVGSEGSDFVPFFYNYGINTIILRNRLRRDGYEPLTDAVNDMLQAIKVVRAYAPDWGIDPRKIGAIGFSAGAELVSQAAVRYPEYDKTQDLAGNPLAKISARPDFAGLIYPGPTPFRGGAAVAIPDDAPPSFLAGGGVGDASHAVWADEYFAAFLRARIPNLEMHIYGNGRHPGDPLPEGGNMSGGLTDRNGIPLGTWQFRLIDWFRDLGFLQKPGVETKAARDVATRGWPPPRRAPSRPGPRLRRRDAASGAGEGRCRGTEWRASGSGAVCGWGAGSASTKRRQSRAALVRTARRVCRSPGSRRGCTARRRPPRTGRA